MNKITEQTSLHNNLEKMSIQDILIKINSEDNKVAQYVYQSINQISQLVEKVTSKLSKNGRLFYIGSGTSGRLGILDASECPPTFCVDNDIVIGLIAGGDAAIRNSIESAEDNTIQAWNELKKYDINEKDIVIGISASGSTPYVLGGLKECQKNSIFTGCITCNQYTEIAKYSDIAIEVVVGPEFVTGSTRMKAGTAQKMVLNMISTATMVSMGKVYGNLMVDLMAVNDKLIDRGIRIIQNLTGLDYESSNHYLNRSNGSVKAAIVMIKNNCELKDAEDLLQEAGGSLRKVID